MHAGRMNLHHVQGSDQSRRHASCTSPPGRPSGSATVCSTGLADLAEAADAYGHASPSPIRRLSNAVQKLEKQDRISGAGGPGNGALGIGGRDALAQLLGMPQAGPEPMYSNRGRSGVYSLPCRLIQIRTPSSA